MGKRFSIIYANRNRSLERIRASFVSLRNQVCQDFEVILVDYGSKPELIPEYRIMAEDFGFVKFYSLEVSQLLWNKSKALNFGFKKSEGEFIFIADVDLIYHPETVSLFESLADLNKFFLFKLGYLNQEESKKLAGSYTFDQLKPDRFGLVNGMVLVGRNAFQEVEGLDEFFHFYGAEDEDLFARLENAGYKKVIVDAEYFYHNWHRSFSGSEDKLLTGKPRVKNIMRLNQLHFHRNKDEGRTKPPGQTEMGIIISPEKAVLLKNPTKKYRINNIQAHVEHFLRMELPSLKGEVVNVDFVEDPYVHTLKYKIKKLMGKQTQAFISLKEVNDLVLKEIVFHYRDHNYSFKVNEDLCSLSFSIAL